MINFKIDLTLQRPYYLATGTVDGEPYNLFVCNPREIDKLQPWLREHLLNWLSAAIETPDGGGEYDNVIHLDRHVSRGDALAARPASASHMIATDR